MSPKKRIDSLIENTYSRKNSSESKLLPFSSQEVREKAERIVQISTQKLSQDISKMPQDEILQTLHELRVHQIELEMQNEELRKIHLELDAARERYFDLYDLAPVGYFTISEKGLIIEANLMAADMLGVAKSALKKQLFTRFIFKEDQDAYYLHRKHLFESGEPQNCNLRMLKKGDVVFWADLSATVAQDEKGLPLCRAVISNITKRKQV
ncbi:MAG: PAS domain-containing protein, partial [Spirochaetales bacterium]|nr:PAS domain-containing protein [Spirochaetales bacterium]